jgi:hypothetical protein
LRHSSFLAICATISALSVGCNTYGNKERTWTEDVTLSDGTRIVIKRHVEFSDSNSLAQDSYGATESKATIEFTGQQASLPVWSAPLIPLVLYQDPTTHEWVVVANTGSCEVWYSRGKPKPAYWEFRLESGQWREKGGISSESIGRPTNLFFNYHAGLPAKHMTMKLKEEDWSDARIVADFRRVQPAEEYAHFCMSGCSWPAHQAVIARPYGFSPTNCSTRRAKRTRVSNDVGLERSGGDDDIRWEDRIAVVSILWRGSHSLALLHDALPET